MKTPLPCFSVAISARKLIGTTIYMIVKWRRVIVSAYSNPVFQSNNTVTDRRLETISKFLIKI